mmetsp:Transcript_6008/g.10710  ORF Transcript_6008/g.10710 Transcript_6008/m.10710 type:complete len:211 (-) Transcript_6008:366-998(-)
MPSPEICCCKLPTKLLPLASELSIFAFVPANKSCCCCCCCCTRCRFCNAWSFCICSRISDILGCCCACKSCCCCSWAWRSCFCCWTKGEFADRRDSGLLSMLECSWSLRSSAPEDAVVSARKSGDSAGAPTSTAMSLDQLSNLCGLNGLNTSGRDLSQMRHWATPHDARPDSTRILSSSKHFVQLSRRLQRIACHTSADLLSLPARRCIK